MKGGKERVGRKEGSDGGSSRERLREVRKK